MTLDDLVKIYTDTFWRGPKLNSDTADHAAIRAVVIALRDEIEDTYEREGCSWDGAHAYNRFNEIIGKEAVLGGSACHSAEHAVPETTPKGER